MTKDSASLTKQIDFVFRQLQKELTDAIAGTVQIHIRNNTVGKFGIKHHPINSSNGQLEESSGKGMTELQVKAFHQMAIDALKYRKNWTHGEITYDFAVRGKNNSWSASVLFESNYNMAYWNSNFSTANYKQKSYSNRFSQ